MLLHRCLLILLKILIYDFAIKRKRINKSFAGIKDSLLNNSIISPPRLDSLCNRWHRGARFSYTDDNTEFRQAIRVKRRIASHSQRVSFGVLAYL